MSVLFLGGDKRDRTADLLNAMAAPGNNYTSVLYLSIQCVQFVFEIVYKNSSGTGCFAVILVKTLVRKVPQNSKVPRFTPKLQMKGLFYGLHNDC